MATIGLSVTEAKNVTYGISEVKCFEKVSALIIFTFSEQRSKLGKGKTLCS